MMQFFSNNCNVLLSAAHCRSAPFGFKALNKPNLLTTFFQSMMTLQMVVLFKNFGYDHGKVMDRQALNLLKGEGKDPFSVLPQIVRN